MLLLIPALVCIVGLLMYVLATNPKVSELGRIAFFVGLLVTLASSSSTIAAYVR